MSRKQPLPTTFVEHHRNYLLDIFPEGRLGSGASSAERCLQTVTFLADGEQFVLVAKYRDAKLGAGATASAAHTARWKRLKP